MVAALIAQHIPEHKVTVPNVIQTHATAGRRSHRTVHVNTARFSSLYASQIRDAAPDQAVEPMRSSQKQDSAKNVPTTRGLHHQTEGHVNLIQARRPQIRSSWLKSPSSRKPLPLLAAPPPVAMFGTMSNSCLKSKLQASTWTRAMEIWASSSATPLDSRWLLPRLSLLFSLQWMLCEHLF